MMSADPSIPLSSLVGLFVSLFIVGIFLTIPLYSFDIRRFVRSSIFIKILFWIPIFLVFIGTLYLNSTGRAVVSMLLILFGFRDFLRVRASQRSKTRAPIYYFLGYSVAISHLYFLGIVLPAQAVTLLIAICMSSVLSDVTAFFMGNYLGRHKLPRFLNNNKSWEGVLGQVIGGVVGVLLVDAFVVGQSSLLIAIPIGVGSALGDLANSYVKRKVSIKDWGNSIPGHGGYLDRFSSLSVSLLLTTYWVSLFS